MSMKKGSTGESVRSLQSALNKIMGAGLKEDGIFGEQTDAAVRAFQKRAGLVVDGVVGQNTLDAIAKVLAVRGGSTAPTVDSGKSKVDTAKDTTISPDGGQTKVDTAKDTVIQKDEGMSTGVKAGLAVLGVLGLLRWRKII